MRRILLFNLIVLLAGLAASCMREIDPVCPHEQKGELATITLAMSGGGTRGSIALTGNLSDDYAITSLRIMVFNSGSPGTLAHNSYNFKLTGAELLDMSNNNIPYRINILPGNYDFVFIANEDSDTELRGGTQTLTQILDAYTTSNTRTNIMNEYFSSSAFQNDLTIPMTAIFRNTTVSSSNTITLAGKSTPEAPPWQVEVERAGIRIDLTLWTDKPVTAQRFEKIQMVNVPNRVYMFDVKEDNTTQNYNDSNYEPVTPTILSYRTINKGDSLSVSGLPLVPDLDITGNVILYPDTKDFEPDPLKSPGYFVWHKRIILPSSYFFDKTDGDKAILMQAVVNGNAVGGKLGGAVTTANPYGYNAPRNQRYRIVGEVKADQPIEFTILQVIDWDSERRVYVNRSLTVTPENLSFEAHLFGVGNSKSITVETNNPGGWTWSISGANADRFYAVQSGNTLTVYPTLENLGYVPLTATITFTADYRTKTVTLVQNEPIIN